jgi:hypothetical protein
MRARELGRGWTQPRERTRARGEEKRALRAGEKAGRRWQAEADAGKRAENRIKLIFLFFFLFPVFQNHFPRDFEIHFEFDSNHSIQNFKCISMNAQSCFYPYI